MYLRVSRGGGGGWGGVAFVNRIVRLLQNTYFFLAVLIFVTSVSVARPTIFWLRETGLAFNDTVFIMCGTNPIELSYFNRISDHVHGLLKDYTDVGSNGNPSSENTKRLLRHLDSVFMIAARSPRGREYERFASQVKARIKEAPFFSTKYDGYKDTVKDCLLYLLINNKK